MSYILDALRRADAERERGAVPGLHAQPALADTPVRGTSSRAVVLSIGLGAATAVLGLAALAWSIWGRPATTPSPDTVAAAAASGIGPQPTQQPTQQTPPAQAAPTPLVAMAPAQARITTPPPAPTETARTPPAAPPPANPSQSSGAATPDTALDTPAPVRRDAPADTRPTRPAPRETTPSVAATSTTPADPRPAASAASPERRLYTLDELPADVRRSMPPVPVGGSIYSEDPASRFLMINGEVVHEGDRIAADLTLEQIQLRFSIVRFKGYRVRIAH